MNAHGESWLGLAIELSAGLWLLGWLIWRAI